MTCGLMSDRIWTADGSPRWKSLAMAVCTDFLNDSVAAVPLMSLRSMLLMRKASTLPLAADASSSSATEPLSSASLPSTPSFSSLLWWSTTLVLFSCLSLLSSLSLSLSLLPLLPSMSLSAGSVLSPTAGEAFLSSAPILGPCAAGASLLFLTDTTSLSSPDSSSSALVSAVSVSVSSPLSSPSLVSFLGAAGGSRSSSHTKNRGSAQSMLPHLPRGVPSVAIEWKIPQEPPAAVRESSKSV
mmetsp:Transcript_15637/g.37308  ORF Transcript_15637/g.37308 Transcript_15637/m.37308 type:complete len:242 (-) Transcript_15637:1315-2040(-)